MTTLGRGNRCALALLGLALAAAGACGRSERTAQTRPPPASGGQGGACLECAGAEGGGPNEDIGGSPETSSAAGKGAGTGGAPDPVQLAPVPPLVLSKITISQTLELPLAESGVEVSEADRPGQLVAGKQALVRVFFEVPAGFEGRELLGVLDLQSPSGDDTLLVQQRVESTSLQGDLTTTLDFHVLARDLEPETQYRVRVLEVDTTPLVRFPTTGYLPLGARQKDTFEVVLVPFVINGFVPKLEQPQLDALQKRLLALYPVPAVELRTADSVTVDYDVDADGNGWDDALDLIYDVRQQAKPLKHVFYYGMMTPAETFDDYCPNGCQTGYSVVASESEYRYRGSIGIAVFPDGSGESDAWDTLAHELGHALGREHSRCGVNDSSNDPDYPYPGAASKNLGPNYGYDFDLERLVRPQLFRDVMGYCTSVWISDYTFRGLTERLDHIHTERFSALSGAPGTAYRVARVRRDGSSSWRADRIAAPLVTGEQVGLLDAQGARIGSVLARVLRVDHASGGYVWLPRAEVERSGAAAVDLSTLGGTPLGW